MELFSLIEQQLPQVLTVVFLVITLIFLLKPLAHKILLVDIPDYRKLHQNNTPLIGGICIFLACGLSLFVFDDLGGQDLRSLIISSSLVLFLGVLDDQFDIRASAKLLTQVLTCSLFVASTGLQISSFGSPFGLSYSFELGLLSLPLTILAIVGLTNAFNMIDGCDGLAASLSVMTLLALLYFGASHFDLLLQKFLLMLVASLFVFLFFNFSNHPALKLFLGDGGSLFLGFVVSVLLVKFVEGNETHRPSMVLWFVAVPIYDFCAVVVRRLLLKRKIMSADRSHLHHYLLSIGFSHFKVTMLILVLAIILLCIGVFLEANYPSFSLVVFVGLFTIYLSLRLANFKN
ncbi:undecaprenyl/decaprenyl-phosphate alpha-N-acetylglucosaminyl 1-phosphate transferase [Alphaproteobacteria bacterium]|nr:undecaprenyl/decaprenyl-phosphate alpha-N-acetylglucosaminyl 1-phosphate transferase [Alphaproteobacteria bacterium]